MAGLTHLKDALEKQGGTFINNLLNKSVIINEKLDGTYFGVKRKNAKSTDFIFYKKSGQLTYVDRILSRFFEPAISYFESLPANIIEKIPPNYLFGLEFFSSNNTNSILYSNPPKNNLILNYIQVQNSISEVEETLHGQEELDKWADLLKVNKPPIIFQGKLTEKQRKEIMDFIYTPISELADMFKTTSFTKYILQILNPTLEMEDRSIEGIVFRFYEGRLNKEDPIFLAKIIDPSFYELSKSRTNSFVAKKSDDYIWIIVIDLMNFIERYTISELRAMQLAGQSYDQKYVSLVNIIFLEFIDEFANKYRDLDIQVPGYLQQDDFDVNFNLIEDSRVNSIIESNQNFKEIYRVFLNMFRQKKLKINSTFFTNSMRKHLNAQIDKITRIIMGESIYENYFPSFMEFVGDEKEPGYFETFKEVEPRRTTPVNIIVSEFQPIHQGHIKSAQNLFNENGLPVVLVCIHSGETTKLKPFKKETVINSLNKVINVHPSFLKAAIVVDDGDIENILREIKPNYEPHIIAASHSRIRDLALQLELSKKRTRNLNLKENLRLMEMPNAAIRDSMLDSIKVNDYSTFKTIAPAAIHTEFFNFNRDINESLETKVINEDLDVEIINESLETNTDEPKVQLDIILEEIKND